MNRDASQLVHEGPAPKRPKHENTHAKEEAHTSVKKDDGKTVDLDKFMSETETFFQPEALNMELETAIASCESATKENSTEASASTDASPYANLFDMIEPSESVSSEEVPNEASKSHLQGAETSINLATVSELKESMASNSRLVATFTVLRVTYLKLCKEFNYLLGKFNENERVKIELIHENNQLRRLLFEAIKDKELDRKKYRADIEAAKARSSQSVR